MEASRLRFDNRSLTVAARNQRIRSFSMLSGIPLANARGSEELICVFASRSPRLRLFLDRAGPIGAQDVDGPDLQPVALRVLDDRGWVIEAHGLVVEQRRGEGGQIVALEIGAGVGQQRETRGVRFGESVQRE